MWSSLGPVPYFSQWETPEMTLAVLSEGHAALLRDPNWRKSGAETIEDYARWAVNVCGMACLKMILATRGDLHRTFDLARACTGYGGYVASEQDASIKGLLYAPFVSYVKECYGLSAETMTGVATDCLPRLLALRPFFIASVNGGIRWPELSPPSKGGHLVLVTAASAETIRFHNPSGHDTASQANVQLPSTVFDRFFANRGVSIGF